MFLFGDFNLDSLKYGSIKQVSEFIDLIFSFGLLQLITKPSRVTLNSATLIDYAITNHVASNYESVLLMSCLSDNFPLFYFYCAEKPKLPVKYNVFRDFSPTNKERFSEAIRSINWEDLYNVTDVQRSYDIFADRFFFF
jgi:hypothetical protein